MTNSEKQTNSSAGQPPRYAGADFWLQLLDRHPTLVVGGITLLAGWGVIWHINNWHFTVPVVMLWLGWFGVLATVRLMWSAGVAAASEAGGLSEAAPDVSDARREELLSEKKSLLRAIKEIEFDRDLGKMSEDDAQEIMKFYRARAIEVIKDLDGLSESSLTVQERIDRDLKARMTIETAKQAAKKKSKQKTQKSSEPKSAKAGEQTTSVESA